MTGFSYNYISPSNFGLDGAYVMDNTLAPEQQAFKALIVRHNDTVTLEGVNALKIWAEQGLSVVFSGGLPSAVSGQAGAEDLSEVVAVLEDMISLPNVYTIPDEDLAKHLVSIVGVSPRTSVQSDRPWLTYWREDEGASITYVVVYNDATGERPGEARSTGSVTFETFGAPYTYDAWTGEKVPILSFEETLDGITIPFVLKGNESTVVAFHHDEQSRALLSLAPSGLYTSVAHGNSTKVIVCDADTTNPHVRSSNSTPDAVSYFALKNWTLTVEAWKAPSDPLAFAQNYTSMKSNTTFQLKSLQPWSTISDSLRNVSGRGFYNSTFDSHSHGLSDGAILNLNFITHTARVWINSHQVPPLDPTRPIADITDFLVSGKNSIEIVVATTLGGSVRAAWNEIQVGANPVTLTAILPDEQDYGLLHPVEIIPCRRSSHSLSKERDWFLIFHACRRRSPI